MRISLEEHHRVSSVREEKSIPPGRSRVPINSSVNPSTPSCWSHPAFRSVNGRAAIAGRAGAASRPDSARSTPRRSRVTLNSRASPRDWWTADRSQPGPDRDVHRLIDAGDRTGEGWRARSASAPGHRHPTSSSRVSRADSAYSSRVTIPNRGALGGRAGDRPSWRPQACTDQELELQHVTPRSRTPRDALDPRWMAQFHHGNAW